MTCLTIFRTSKTAPRGPLLPMHKHDAVAWEETRQRHPHLYEKGERT